MRSAPIRRDGENPEKRALGERRESELTFATKTVDDSLARSSARRGSHAGVSARIYADIAARIHLFEKLLTLLCGPFVGTRRPSEARKRHFPRMFSPFRNSLDHWWSKLLRTSR